MARRRISLLKKLVFASIPLLLMLLLLELGWRVYLWRTGRGFLEDPREFTSAFFTTYEEPLPEITGDRLRYLDGPIPRRKVPGEVRVIAFGGSTTVNFRAGISYPAILAEAFARKFGADPPVRVLNAGGEGYSTAHTLVNLSLRNLDAAPDIVTVMENINDLSAVWFGDSLRPDYANKYLTDFYLGLRHRAGPIAELSRVSRLARFFVLRIEALAFPTARERRDRDWRPGRELFARNLHSIVAVARAHGVRVLLASQPARADCRDEPFLAYNDAIRRVATDEGVPFVDLAAIVTADALFLDDCIHSNRAGVERVAAALHDPLASLVAEVRKRRGG